jgi:acetyl-CoA carboxylase biotin carboxyl carrier protein
LNFKENGGFRVDYKQIQELIKGFEASNITHLELEMDALKLKLNKTVTEEVVVTKPVKKVVEETVMETASTGHEVRSPLVGTYYEASSPSEAPFIKVGQQVKQGDTVCIIEAMKIMNEITAPCSGTVESINLKNGEVVGYDQVILTIV